MAGPEFVPASFIVPRELITAGFGLKPLGPQHNAADYAAWTSSIEHILATPGFGGSSWPAVGMTAAENLAELRQHGEDFVRRVGFTYTVLEPSSREVIGCV